MKDKDLQSLAQRFAEETDNAVNHKDFAEAYAMKFLQWLSSKYCIVEKIKVIESYREHKEYYERLCKSQWDETPYQCEEQGAMDELKSLFGKELFTDTEQ